MKDIDWIVDRILTLDSLSRLIGQHHWSPVPYGARDFNDQCLTLYRNFYYESGDVVVVNRCAPGMQALTARLVFNPVMKVAYAEVYDGSGDWLREDSVLLHEVLTGVIKDLEDVATLSYAESVDEARIDDHIEVWDFLQDLAHRYGVMIPPDLKVITVPVKIWASLPVSEELDATYFPEIPAIAFADRPYKSRNYFRSLLVHQGVHAIQDRVGAVAHYAEVGLEASEMQTVAAHIETNSSYRALGRDLAGKADILFRCVFIQDMNGMERFRDRFSLPVERNAVAEQVIYLRDACGLEMLQIEKAMSGYFAGLGSSVWGAYQEILFAPDSYRESYFYGAIPARCLDARKPLSIPMDEVLDFDLSKLTAMTDLTDLSDLSDLSDLTDLSDPFAGDSQREPPYEEV